MRYKLGLLLLLLAILVAACGGDAESTETPLPVGDGDATQTAPQIEGDDSQLTESYSDVTTTSGILTFNYPQGWTRTGTADELTLSNGNTGETIAITVMTEEATTAMGNSPTAILASFASNTTGETGLTFDEPEDVNFGANSGAMVSTTDDGIGHILAIVQVNEDYVFLSYTGPEDRMEANRELLEAIGSSITLG